jgi:hypothetical protein
MAIEASDGKNKVTVNVVISVIRDVHVPKFGIDKYAVTINENMGNYFWNILSFCTFSFGHCVVCSSSIYRF